jgi:Coenzyme PQQ synthesis protein D (PqqD)
LTQSIHYRLRCEDVAWRALDGEGVLVDLVRRRLHSCNASATLVVEALHSERTAEELARAVRDLYDVETEIASMDVEKMLAKLEQEGVVSRRDTDVLRVTRPDDTAASKEHDKPKREQPASNAGEQPAKGRARRAYVAPDVSSNELFYVLAAGCGKVVPTETSCRAVPSNS